ncbi:MAG: hypothetical protein GX594_01525 [Pirellulaceae bacterium]|nr:hypothetical protein [Pirellulaceae bacterium]
MPHNPFSSHNIRPGAMPFIFPEGENADSMVRRLRENGWRGEIVGGHGEGKSTLLAELLPALRRAGRKPLLIELHDGQRRLPLDLDACCRAEPFDLLIVDGCEQLGRWNRLRLKRLCRRRGWGLLATAHGSVGLPRIYRASVSPELAAKVVEQLLAGRTPSFDPAEISAAFERQRGNLREMLFDLYDVHERQQPKR